jgi:hypothetical protein
VWAARLGSTCSKKPSGSTPPSSASPDAASWKPSTSTGSRQSEILDYDRARRLFSAAQRAVMAMRQKFRCAAERCDRATAWADAHHLDPWSSGGKTDLADGVMICGPHHRLAPPPRLPGETTTRLAHLDHPHPTRDTPTPTVARLPSVLPR